MLNSFVYPPEWEQQNSTILIFPQRGGDWDCCFDEVVESFINLISVIAKYQKVYVIGDIKLNIDRVEVISQIPINDTWGRDSLPLNIFRDGTSYFLNYQFNGWGQKFDSYYDNLITHNLIKQSFLKYNSVINLPYVVEGGAIETNGEVLLVTESSILNQNRGQDNIEAKQKIEESFYKYFGVKQVVWLKNSFLENDDTDGHIDMLARFVDKNTIFYSLDSVGRELKNKLPNMRYIQLPSPTLRNYPATYLNFIFVNGAVLIPIYGVIEDQKAISIFKNFFLKREVVSIDSSLFIKQGGSLHCLTMQIYSP